MAGANCPGSSPNTASPCSPAWLRSPTAARVNIEIMRAFVRLRRLLATPGELVEQIAKLGETVRLHDDQIKTIIDVLRQMMEKPPEPPKGRIGFQPAPAK